MHDDRSDPSGVAIIGMSGRFPGASNLTEFWANLRDGVESIAFFDDADLATAGVPNDEFAQPGYVKAGARPEGIDLFDADFFGYTPREATIMDPQHRIFLETSWEALEHAGYDPARCPDTVGVFGGACTSAYLANVFSNLDAGAAIGASNVGLGNELGFLAARVSFKLNLRGPSIPVHTACSSSLVAVHLACQSLLNYECDMAIAGGVAFKVTPHTGYLFQDNGIMSPDGHCRPFDADARGTIFNNGAGVVVLKRLGDALSAGDTVHAVIKGSAVNNDGAAKASFTAPGVAGQADVVTEALDVAEVEADTVGYVEAHGSGTTIGDSLEIQALTRAFRRGTDRTGFCAIGSVKSNLGHLDAAAGIAGLLKVVLSLRHQLLPPTVHFRQPNPQIDFAATPFQVQRELQPWPAADHPRRAGVSAFGFGGTNAHLIVEEAPAATEAEADRPVRLLVLSARTEKALAQATDRLVSYLRHEPAPLPDVAYTLTEGRHAFEHRRIVVASQAKNAAADLESRAPGTVADGRAAGGPPQIGFVFSGRPSTVFPLDLYEYEPVFRDAVDRCVEILRASTGLRLQDVLQDATGDDFARPVTFLIQYALVELWRSWGVRPDVLDGHGVGELVAACVSGVFSLEDALTMATRRATPASAQADSQKQLIAARPGLTLVEIGSDTTAFDSASAAIHYTLGQLWLAGADVDWTAYHQHESRHRVALPTYPFQRERYWLDRVAPPAAAPAGHPHPLLDRLLVHTMSEAIFLTEFAIGRHWVLDEHRLFDAAMPPSGVYLEMACAAARDYLGLPVTTLLDVEFPDPLLIRTGETRTVHTTVRQAKDDELEFTVVSHTPDETPQWTVLGRGRLSTRPQPGQTCSIDELRTECEPGAGEAAPDVVRFGPHWDGRGRVDVGDHVAIGQAELPARYETETGEYLLHPALFDITTGFPRLAMRSPGADHMAVPSRPGLDLPRTCDRIVIHRPIPPRCVSVIRSGEQSTPEAATGRVDVLVLDPAGAAVLEIEGLTVRRIDDPSDTLLRPRPASVHHTIRWIPAPRRSAATRQPERVLVVGHSPEMAEPIMAALRVRGIEVTTAGPETDWSKIGTTLPGEIVFIAPDVDTGVEGTPHCQDRLLEQGVHGLFRLARTLAEQGSGPHHLTVVAPFVNDVTGAEPYLIAEHAALFGLAKTIRQENDQVTCRCVDVATSTAPATTIAEILTTDQIGQVAYRDGERYAGEVAEVDLTDGRTEDPVLTAGGVYLITGGLGGLGLEVARYISATQPDAGIALVSRRAMPSAGQGDTYAKQAGVIEEITARGTRIRCYQGDAADQDDMAQVVHAVRAELGRISGVIHAAGRAGDGFILRKREDVLRATLAPKVAGARILDAVTSDDPPDFMVLFSSTTALFGAAGQSDYTAANLYLDSFAAQRDRRGRRTVTINWTDWLGTGMADEHKVPPDQGFFRSIGITDAIGSLDAILRSGRRQVIVGEINYGLLGLLDSQVLDERMARSPLVLAEPIRRAIAARSAGKTTKPLSAKRITMADAAVHGRADDSYSDAERQLAQIWAHELGLTEIDVFATLFDLGGDSLLAMRLANTIHQVTGAKVTIGEIFQSPTIAQLASHLGAARPSQDRPGEHATTTPPDDAWFGLSHAQQGLWLLHQLDDTGSELNLPLQEDVHGTVDLAAFRRSVDYLIQRHRALRMVFDDTGEQPRQRVLLTYSLDVALIDLTARPDPPAAAERLVHQDCRQVFDLTTPPVRARLYKLAEDHFRVCFVMHHLVCDGVSLGIFLRELQDVYSAFASAGAPQLEPLPTTFDDYVRAEQLWLAGPESRAMAEYWRGHLAPPLPRSAIGQVGPGHSAKALDFVLDAAGTAALTARAKELDVTVHILLLSVYATVLGHVTACDDMIIGIPFSGRHGKELESLVGYFVNPLALRVRLSGRDTFADTVSHVNQVSLGAYQHGRYPFGLLVDDLNPPRTHGRNPLFSTLFQVAEFLPPVYQTVQQDICLFGRLRDGRIDLRIAYDGHRVTPQTAADVLAGFTTVVERITGELDIATGDLVAALAPPGRIRAEPARRGRLQSLISSRGDRQA